MRPIITRSGCLAALAAAAALAPALGVSPALGANLLQNPGAEASPGSSDGSSTGTPPGWTVTEGSVAVVAYGASGGFPGTDVSTRVGGGANFFGGAVNPVARMNQVVDVSAQGASIDAGQASATISGLLGGWAEQSDNATAAAVFLGSAGSVLGRVGIGPVSTADRNGVTDLLARSASAKVPKGTRSIRVEVVLTRNEGSYDDGYADNLSLDLAAKPAWPKLASARVPLSSVANGCGPAGSGAPSDPRWADTSTYRDPALRKGRVTVSFRRACDLHDAGYTGAYVNNPISPFLNRDYFPDTRRQVDDQFRRDMLQMCNEQIPSAATSALAACRRWGVGARLRAVEVFGWFRYWPRPNLSAAWVDPANPSATGLTLLQTRRSVRGAWRGGAAAPGVRGEFRGTLISLRDGASVVKGWAMVTDAAGVTTLSRMEIEVPPRHRRIVVTGPASVAGTRVRD